MRKKIVLQMNSYIVVSCFCDKTEFNNGSVVFLLSCVLSVDSVSSGGILQ